MNAEETLSLQEIVAPESTCFGCGVRHPRGLHIKSYWDEEGQCVVARYRPAADYAGWPGLVYGGFLAMLIDCHSNWTVMANHYRHENRPLQSQPKIDCVTAELNISYKKPTPMGVELDLRAWVEGEVGRKTTVICEIRANDVLTVRARSVFARVDTAVLKHQAHGTEDLTGG
jgi:acyl-coenzyme A thioesterase PaaI-like protein